MAKCDADVSYSFIHEQAFTKSLPGARYSEGHENE